MNPKPFASLNHLTVPVAIAVNSSSTRDKTGRCPDDVSISRKVRRSNDFVAVVQSMPLLLGTKHGRHYTAVFPKKRQLSGGRPVGRCAESRASRGIPAGASPSAWLSLGRQFAAHHRRPLP